MKSVCSVLMFAACAMFSAAGFAQAYPSKPIRVISPSGAGGPVDVICRAISQRLSEELRQQLVVENRVGAAGLIGTEMVVKSPPDGYTLLFGFSGPLAIVPNLNPNTPYDVQRDLVPIAQVAEAQYVLLVHPIVPAKSVRELVALAKAQPGRLNFGSGGVGVGIHMASELLKVAAGIDLVHVPYKGAAPAMTALMAGEVDMMFNGLPPTLAFIKNGRVRALAVGGEKRSAVLPELPTVKEASGLDFKTGGWYGFLAPRGTPPSVVAQLSEAIKRTLGRPELESTLSKLATEIVYATPQQFDRKIREESAVWGKVIKAAGIKYR
ncbi:MAG: tripartite tricarboxylate transporter substrate binding protein [Betaproteobacteria bacterium]|nr:tripartite tricarboxylate transporter substrate binding protein [Betaproteobacteria bacterium]